MDGGLPPFWQRNVVFFANLLALFFGNEAETESLADEVGEIDSYGGRLIPILNTLFQGQDNLLVLEREPDAALCGYFRDELALSLPDLRTMSHREYAQIGERLAAGDHPSVRVLLAGPADHGAEWVDGFVTDPTLARIAERLGKRTVSTFDGSWRGNNKLLLHEYIVAQGLPHVDTILASNEHEVRDAARELARRGFKAAALKSQIGASGIGIAKLEGIDQELSPDAITDDYFFEGPCMVQGWLAPGVHGVTQMRSPSVQLFLDESSVHLYDMTEQILSQESVHEGNVSPPPYVADWPGLRSEILSQAGEVGRWLYEQGYRGTASADFLIAEREDQQRPDVYVCEINARVTGATYPSVLARKFTPSGAWLMRNIRLSHPMAGDELLHHFRAPGHLYQPGRVKGVLPINFNFGADGLIHKGQFLCLAPTSDECHDLLDLARGNLGVDWLFERD